MDQDHPHIALLTRQFSDGVLPRREFLRSATLLGLSAATAYGMIGEVAPTQARADMPQGGTLRIGMKVFEITSPHAAVWNHQAIVYGQVVEWLTKTGADNITRPWLLERWEASEDLLTWDLYVRQGVSWRNGRDFTADEVVWNLERVLDEAAGSSVLGLMKGYMLTDYEADDGTVHTRLWDANAIERIGAHHVRLNLSSPQLAVPEHLYHYPMAILDPEEDGHFGVGSNGTGAFDLVEMTVEQSARLEARSDYWGEGPYLDAIEVIDLGDDTSAGIGALISRQVHMLDRGDPVQIGALEGIGHLQRYQTPTAATGVVRGKCNKPPFDDPRVRKALRLATATEPVLQGALFGVGAEAEHHHVAPIHPEYAALPKMERNPEAARALLAEAGYADGGPAFEITVPQYTWTTNAVAIMAEQWKEAGFEPTIHVVPLSLWGEVWNTAPVTYTTWSHRPLGVMILALAYRTGVPWNESEYSNPEFDELITRAEGIVDYEKRREVMTRIEQIMQEDGPITQPIWRGEFTYADEKLRGFAMHPSMQIFGNELAFDQS